MIGDVRSRRGRSNGAISTGRSPGDRLMRVMIARKTWIA